MPQFFMFKCAGAGCKEAFKGPEVKPGGPNPKVGDKFNAVPGVACSNKWHKGVFYTGTENLPPDPPPQAGAKPKPLPTVWVPDGGGGYAAELKYPNIPAAAQEQLIDTLGPILGDADARVPLLGATTDRFDDYADVEDDPIKPGPKAAEKFLTLAIVLGRLDAVAEAFGPMDLWKQARIDRNLNGLSADLMLPSGTNGFRFHLELLNDLVNPRGGHSVPAATYAAAITKSIALRAANAACQDQRGDSYGYFFYSTASNRGLKVVHQGAARVLTCYFSGAATAWWARPNLPAQVRLERTIA